jgi:hypothetical protein
MRICFWALFQWDIINRVSLDKINQIEKVIISHQNGAGLGNVWHSMMAAVVMAIVEAAPLFVSFDSHPQTKQGRWLGAFSQAVDMKFNAERLDSLTRHWDDAQVKVVIGPGADADRFWACEWGRDRALRNYSKGTGRVFSFHGGSFPLEALGNAVYGNDLRSLFGSNMDFYLGHFLVSAAPEIREAANVFLQRIRSKDEFIIGVCFWCLFIG